MEGRRLLPYVVGLLVLAFALGSLPRSEPGGSLLFRSYWLLYLIYLGPLVILGIMVALILLIALNWKDLSQGIGYGLAGRRRQRKPRSRRSFVVAAFFWALALGVLLAKGCRPICKTGMITTTTKVQIVGANASAPDPLQIGNAIPVVENLVQTNWFGFAFLGLLIVSGVVIFQSIRVAVRETRETNSGMFAGNQEQGLEAVQEAMKLVDDSALDPRSRIMACYQHLISATSRLGAPVSSDQTARELERGIRSMFSLKGSGIHELTQLFEEARYSLHPITEEDAKKGYQHLQSIATELNIQITVQP